ncbi:Fc receptor-like protein 2 [Monodelphis domestica]|uniref:Fc receptor-like protein 2 n=1 Tax=Monodelphis domestica TaxID=13616 RepID=UPI0024E24437|nr:Fc receptor-like protein 2 [Monodelphis domestica]
MDLHLTLLWVLLLDLGLVSRQASTAKKAMVHLSPQWTTIFEGEKVNLTCDGSDTSKLRIRWLLNNEQLKYSTKRIETMRPGEYKCQDQHSALSDPVHLVVSPDNLPAKAHPTRNNWKEEGTGRWELSLKCLLGSLTDPLILQTPYSVFEGDTLVLRCRTKYDARVRNMKYYKDGKILSYFLKNSVFVIPQVGLSHSAQYHCTATTTTDLLQIFQPEIRSRKVALQIQELFPPPELKVTSYQPIEGTPIALSCDTQLPPQKSDTELHFTFFRDGRTITSDWMRSRVLQIPAIWREDSGSYSCEARAVAQDIRKQSKGVKINVKRIPISGIIMKTEPSRGQVTEGEKLVFICSVTQGTGNITFSWHREGINASLGKKTRYSLEEKLILPAINESDAGKYYCTADNNINTISSLTVKITVKIPVSRPLFTLSTLRTQVTVGDVVQFQCKALRGSLPIQYQFYHDGEIFENKIDPSGSAASFNLSMKTGHSGNYFCKAINSFSDQCSEIKKLSVSEPIRSQRNIIIMGVAIALIVIFILTAIALVLCFRLQRKSEGNSASGPYRASTILNPQEPVYSNSSAQIELVPIYGNVNPTAEDIVYSEIWSTQQGKAINPTVGDVVYSEVCSKEHGKEAKNTKNPPEDKDSSVIYSKVI